MEKGSLPSFTSIIELISSLGVCDYIVIERNLSGQYFLKGCNYELESILTDNEKFIDLEHIFSAESLKQLNKYINATTNEIWKIGFIHPFFDKYKGYLYLFEIDQVIIILTKQKGLSFLNSSRVDIFFNFIHSYCFCTNIQDTTITYVSPVINSLYNLKVELFIENSINTLFDYVHHDELKIFQEKLIPAYQIKDNLVSSPINFRFKDKNGQYHLISQKQAFIGVDNNYTGIFYFAQDMGLFIENEKKSEEGPSLIQLNDELKQATSKLNDYKAQIKKLTEKYELRNSELDVVYTKLSANEEIFRQLVENTTDVFMLRDNLNYIYINSQFEKVWGREIFELIEHPYKLSEWIHPEDIQKVEQWLNLNQLVTGKTFFEQYRIIKPNGTIRWIWTRTFPVCDEKNIPYRIVSISTDITDQKEFETALLHAKEKALESDMLKSNFLANISHEIRTPMNGVVGFSELLCHKDIDPQTRKNYISIIRKSSEQLIRIIDDIIDFARIEANQIVVSPVKFNLNILINDLVAIFRQQLALNNKLHISLDITKSAEDENAVVVADDNRIRQILFNLLDNAVKFTLNGQIIFGYSIKNDKIEFYVSDTGIGIQEELHDTIFKRFRQADEGHTRKFGGTGLGLPIAKGLVNILGGSIWMESIQNQGSNFYFTVPFKYSTDESDNEQESDPFTDKYLWNDKIILIAEDDELNFQYVKSILESTQAKIIRANDGTQVIKMCSNINFSLILMDVYLPVLNGIEAARHLRDIGIKTPIIAQTAYASDEDERNSIEAGCNRYITKPVSKEILYSMIENLLK